METGKGLTVFEILTHKARNSLMFPHPSLFDAALSRTAPWSQNSAIASEASGKNFCPPPREFV